MMKNGKKKKKKFPKRSCAPGLVEPFVKESGKSGKKFGDIDGRCKGEVGSSREADAGRIATANGAGGQRKICR